MPYWRIVFSTFCGCMSFHTGSVIHVAWLLRSTVRMSASHPKATESLRSSEMTLSAMKRHMQRSKQHRLFDHLVGAGEQGRRDVETQGSCRLQVDYELELGPLLHRQVSWFCPFENFVDEAGRAVPHVFDASSIGEQATCLSHMPHSPD